MEVKEDFGSDVFLSSRTTQEVPFGYRRTAVGVIPTDWMICALGSFCEIVAGGDLVKEDFSMEIDQRHPFPVFSNALSRSGLYGYSTSSKFGPDCITVTARGDIGHAYYRSERFCAIGRVLVISPRQKQTCDLRFVTECINNLVKFALESTGVPQLTAPEVAKYEVPLPPSLGEQKAIAAVLSDADVLIKSLEQLIAKKRRIKQGAMQTLLTGERRLPGFSGEWSTKKFGEVATIRADRVDPRKNSGSEFCVELEHIESGTGRLLGSSDAASQSSTKSVFLAGDVLFGKLRAYLRKYWFADRSGVCSTEIWCLRPKGMLRAKAFLFYLVQMDEFIDIASVAYGTHMPRSDWNAIKEFPLRIPKDDEEQAAIAAILADMDSELAQLAARLAKTRQLKQGLMQELLTGGIRLV